jgi:hypothetical protein
MFLHEMLSQDVLKLRKLVKLISDRMVLKGNGHCCADSSWMWERKSLEREKRG